jgi:rRNA-processing protein FCF1
MADDAVPTTDPNPPGDDAPSNGKGTAGHIQKEVASRLGASGPAVVEAVIEELVSAKKEERKKLILAGLTKRREAEQELKKAENTKERQYDGAGKEIGSFYTKQQADAIKQAKEKLDKIDRALDGAMADKPDYEKLSQVVK